MREKISPNILWAEIACDRRHIAGPWVPMGGIMYVHSLSMEPIAKANSIEEMRLEEARLEDLGYELTDKGRVVPSDWFEWKEDVDDVGEFFR